MINQNFLGFLLHKKKIYFDIPNPRLAAEYLTKSEGNLSSARILWTNEKYGDAIPLAYFAAYNSAQALLQRLGIICKNHTATIQLIQKIFSIDTATLVYLKNERIKKQYTIEPTITSIDAQNAIDAAQEFHADMKIVIDSLTEDDYQKYRKEGERLLNSL
jgi:uncharacterized protein (UPF0332 family)